MPYGIAIMRWDDRLGAEVIAKYPADLNYTTADLIRVYDIHENLREAGITYFNNEKVNIISYYAGREYNLYIILKLTILEDPDNFEDLLNKISDIIIDNYTKNDLNSILKKIWNNVLEED
ncbi:MAG: hypothetical protein P8Y70_00570 [Candidatus Lokiarchaeota archaeon]